MYYKIIGVQHVCALLGTASIEQVQEGILSSQSLSMIRQMH